MNQINHVFYINLKSRADRNQFCLNQLKKIDMPLEKIERFEAVENKEGAIGCTLSHIQCLKKAIERNYDNIMIVEDDIYFTQPEYFKEKITKIFEYSFDVFLLGTNLFDFEKIDQDVIRVLGGGTTTGYIVQKHYYQKLLGNYKEGLELLIKTGKKAQYCIDSYSIRTLQPVDQWLSFSKLTVSQVQDYSNIENRVVNYDRFMLKNIETLEKIQFRLPN
jgi:glycosyl transferase family 25